MSTRARWIARASAIAVIAAGFGWMVHGIDLHALADVLVDASLWPIVIAALINFGLIACKALAWRVLLGAEHPVPVRRLFNYTVTSSAASIILPFRGGELVRLWMLRDRDGVPFTHSTAVAVAEKVLDIVAMLIVVAPMPWCVPALPTSLRWWIGGLALGSILTIVLLRTIPTRRRFVERLAVIGRARVLIPTVLILSASWLIDLVMIVLVMRAVGIELPVGAALLVLFAVNVTIAVPSTPGQFGALELGAMLGLHLLKVPDAQSLAFALIYHVLQIIPVAIAGVTINGRAILMVRRDH